MVDKLNSIGGEFCATLEEKGYPIEIAGTIAMTVMFAKSAEEVGLKKAAWSTRSGVVRDI